MARTPCQDSSRIPGWIEPMLAKPDGGRLREGPDWTYEYKLDGYLH
jgi:bifunctional non-homologous end joining protein LigD